jgi:uracil-DNA glycosylase
MDSPFRFPESLPPGWKSRLSQEASENYFIQLTHFLRAQYAAHKEIFPPQNLVFAALEAVDYPDVRVLLLGQDPYHGKNQALGLSFAVPNEHFPKPPSLQNILKEIKTDIGVEIPKDQSDLSGWVEQGVLLLNAVLTVEEANPASHRGRGWESFTDRVIQHLNEREKPVIFMLWGNDARQKKRLITKPQHFILEGPHPSPLSAHRGFLGCRHFSLANQILVDQIGSPPIDWGHAVAKT